MQSENGIVYVTTQTAAQSSPTFVIEHEGRFYVTLAVLEYDPKAADITPEQKRGVAQMQKMFEAAHKQKGLRAGRLQSGWTQDGPVNSGPINSGPNRPRPQK